MLLTPF